MALPTIGYNEKIYIDPFVMPITTERLNKELQEQTINEVIDENLILVN